MLSLFRSSCALLVALALVSPVAGAAPPKLKLLFLGDQGHHRPAERFRELKPVLAKRNIELTYTEKVTDLNSRTLAAYDGLIVYANIDKIAKEQEKALLDYVAGGKGFIPLHCASYCFRNSQAFVDLVGAQFRSHGTGIFRTKVAKADHPIMKGYSPFRSWDETYVHTKHNTKDRIVLEERVSGGHKEPWTWVRTHGKGRVFYTAWGHDSRTWTNAGFQNLVERGIRWACGGDPSVVPAHVDEPTMTKLPEGKPPFKYVEAKVPFYPAGARWGTMGKPITKMQLPLSPEESMKRMIVPEGFEVKLFASEKLLGGKPICMAWDEKGRLWAGITQDYPNQLQPKGKGRDRIVIVEDTDGDGVGDKVTTFADKLSIPTSLTFYKGGIIVHQAPETLYLKDTKGTGKADLRKVLFTGWRTNDTHAGPSNLHYGLDNWIHGIVGYAGFAGRVGKERHSFQTGFYRFKPDGSAMEFLRNTNNNSWGVGFSEEGIHFGSTANGNPSVYLPIPNRYYEAVNGWSSSVLGGIAGNARINPITDKVRQVDHHGRFTAAAGHALYTARTYPKEYWNRTAFVTEPTGHVLTTFVIQGTGADFRSRNAWNMLASDDEWCAPIMAEVGPDGHVWVIDWYNYIVQHNPTPIGFKTGKGNAYETELRDKKHGRIYRIVYKKAPKAKIPDLSKADAKTLVATLKHDNMLWRKHAQRLLVERGKKDVVPDLLKLIEDKKVDEIGLNVGAIHALWTLEGLGPIESKKGDTEMEKVMRGALNHPSAGVRRNAALLVGRTERGAVSIVKAGLLKDGDDQVRLAAFLGISTIEGNSEPVAKALVQLLDNEDVLGDRWLSDGFTAAAAAFAQGVLVALEGRKTDLSPAAVRLVTLIARHHALVENKSVVLDPTNALLQSLSRCRPSVAEAILAGLANWKKSDEAIKPATEEALVKLLPRLSSSGKASLLRLTTALGSKGFAKHAAAITKALLKTAADDKAKDDERTSAAAQVISLRPDDAKAVEELLQIITVQTPPAVVTGLLDAIGQSKAETGGAAILKKMATWTPAAKGRAIRVLLSRGVWTSSLLDAVEKGTIKFDELALDQKQALASHPTKKIADRAKKLLAKGGGLPNPDRDKIVKQFLPLTKKKGSVAGGKAMFEKHCAKCHMHSGKGAHIGPDLTGMAAHPKEEMVVHILDPSRSVEGNFRVYTVTTHKGQVYTGMLASETRTTVELIDAEAKKTIIQRTAIDTLTASTKSLMPEGFEKQMKETEFVDLLEFLAARGKFLPLPLDKVATIVSTKGMFFSKDSTIERMVFSDWKPKTYFGVPFVLTDPLGDKRPNVILLHGPEGTQAPKMPKSVKLPCNSPAKSIHLLSGVSGWGHPLGTKGSVSMIVRLHYKDGKTEDHELKNGVHFADYIRRVEVTGSKFAASLNGKQIRYLAVQPKRTETIKEIELLKGKDRTAPIVMAVTVETADEKK